MNTAHQYEVSFNGVCKGSIPQLCLALTYYCIISRSLGVDDASSYLEHGPAGVEEQDHHHVEPHSLAPFPGIEGNALDRQGQLIDGNMLG